MEGNGRQWKAILWLAPRVLRRPLPGMYMYTECYIIDIIHINRIIDFGYIMKP